MGKNNYPSRIVEKHSKNYLGMKKINKQGSTMEIIEYNRSNDILVKFSEGGFVKKCQISAFYVGSVYNPYFNEVYGVGFLGESKIDRKSYQVWRDMMKRCYDGKKEEYSNCFVCDEWHNYSNFKEWFDKNYYELNEERVHLDKDILVKGNKIYSPNTCIFAPQRINDFFVRKRLKNRNTLLGTSITKEGRYKTGISIKNKDGVHENTYLGTFKNQEEAFYVYKKAKEDYLKIIAEEYKDKIPQKLYKAMYEWEVNIND